MDNNKKAETPRRKVKPKKSDKAQEKKNEKTKKEDIRNFFKRISQSLHQNKSDDENHLEVKKLHFGPLPNSESKNRNLEENLVKKLDANIIEGSGTSKEMRNFGDSASTESRKGGKFKSMGEDEYEGEKKRKWEPWLEPERTRKRIRSEYDELTVDDIYVSPEKSENRRSSLRKAVGKTVMTSSGKKCRIRQRDYRKRL